MNSFNINNFEGPLDLLWQLIQQNEVDIYEVPLRSIVEQYIKKMETLAEDHLDQGAEFIASASALLWLKSKALLPKEEHQTTSPEDDFDPRFEVIHQLIDYCHFRQAAKELAEREQRQSAFYVRGIEENEIKKNLGIHHLSLEDLAAIFKQVLDKAKVHTGSIQEEEWLVKDKIKYIQYLLTDHESIQFKQLFNSEKSREELIVTFLALLELMKSGDVLVVKSDAAEEILLVKPL